MCQEACSRCSGMGVDLMSATQVGLLPHMLGHACMLAHMCNRPTQSVMQSLCLARSPHGPLGPSLPTLRGSLACSPCCHSSCLLLTDCPSPRLQIGRRALRFAATLRRRWQSCTCRTCFPVSLLPLLTAHVAAASPAASLPCCPCWRCSPCCAAPAPATAASFAAPT